MSSRTSKWRQAKRKTDDDIKLAITPTPQKKPMLEEDLSSEEEMPFDERQFKEDIAQWTVKANVPQTEVKNLLGVMRKHHFNFPKDPRALQNTPRSVAIQEKAGGKYIYLGIEEGLRYILCDMDIIPDALDLQFNIDGVPLKFTNNNSLWPILCRVFGFTYRPFVVCLFLGNGDAKKPQSANEYLDEFVKELLQLQQNGFSFKSKVIEVSTHSFVCDAPARSFIKGTKAHNGFYACERCVVKGHRAEKPSRKNPQEMESSGVMVFIGTDHDLRRNDDLIEFKYSGRDEDGDANHQIERTILLGNFSFVTKFPIDTMHSVALGAVKRLFMFWEKGASINKMGKLRAAEWRKLKEKVCNLHGKLPREFQRQPRSVGSYTSWKANECRQFLLYVVPVVLREILDTERYTHFIALSIAFAILCNPSDHARNELLDYSRNLLKFFVDESIELYSEEFVVYNIHSLVHLADDAEHFQCDLMKLSAYPFESFMSVLKATVRCANSPIVQVVKRLHEQQQSGPPRKQHFQDVSIDTSDANCVVFLSDTEIGIVKSIEGDKFMYEIFNVSLLLNLFPDGYNSLQFKIGIIPQDLLMNAISYESNSFNYVCKAIGLPCNSGLAVFPLESHFFT